MKIKKELLENAQSFDPFSDMPPGTREKCKLASDLAMAIHRYRVKYELSQSDLAQRLNMRQSQVSKLENGECNLTIERMQHILSILHYEIIIQPASSSYESKPSVRSGSWFGLTVASPKNQSLTAMFA